MTAHKLPAALLIIRLSIAGFFGVWASLKFYRPEWFENVFRNMYGLDFITQDLSTYVGSVQMIIVVIFALGLFRTFSYGALVLMQGAGVLGSASNLMNYTSYPNNLMWAAVPALGAAIALFILRHDDLWTLDALSQRKDRGREATTD
ncbi:hypothetical protein [Pseudooctadecabacter jejudonensis]|uniref:DoxX n=1 Tax=Pseudooctadecabacter jejudonensis TaxID=1391910 RepID=A0A1Y5SME9_9RHOB|nr:hypothetical protein [Pseudooctadecabacter jejudonensis]SLN44128.1 hypothetical protein PSJ8397_02280 [Pseudooctadecabacter jejudonensis]